MSLLNLLRHISLKRLRLHKAHTIMSICGIALGVSAIVSIGIVSTSVVRSFEESIISIAGKSNLQITGGQSGFPEAMLERVQAVPGVEYAVPVIETAATLVGKGDRSVMIIGVDMLQDQHIRDYRVTEENADIPDPLMFLAKPDSVLVTRGMADVITIGMDHSIMIETVHGIRPLTVRGLLEPVGPAKTMGDSLAIMDIYAAQMAFGKEGRIDRIDVSVQRGEEIEAVRKRIAAVLPQGYTVDSPAVRSAQIEGILSNTKRNMSTIAFTAIMIGMYLIYNAVSITIVHRRREIGVLRALGTSRGGIIMLFLSETAAISLLGSALGIGLGVLFAHGSMETVGKSIAVQYQLTSTAAVPVLISGRHIITGFVIGIVTSVLAALFPAFAAARITPMSAIRSLPFSEEEFLSRRKLMILSIVLLTAAAGLFFLYRMEKTISPKYLYTLIMTCQFCILFGATFALPSVLRFVIAFFQRSIASRLGAVSRLAGLNIRKNVNRNAVAAGAVFLAITLFINISNMIFSVRTAVMQWLATSANADLFITAGHPFSGQSGKHVPMPLEMQEEIDKIDGVRLLDIYRQTFIPFNGSKILVESIDVRKKLDYSTLMVTRGNAKDIGNLLPGQNNIVASENLAVRYNIKPGDTLVLTTPAGPVPFAVIAIAVDYGYEFGAVVMDKLTYRKYWHDDLADIILIKTTDKESVAQVRDAIRTRYGKKMRLFIFTLEEYRREGQKLIDQIYALFHTMDVLTLSIACLGIIITLLASVLERTREIGIIRSIGAFKTQVSRIVVLESVLLGVTGGVLGVICGSINGWLSVEGFIRGEAGMTVDYLLDYSAIIKVIFLAIVFSALAGLYPAKRAAKTNVVEALAYE